MGSGANSSKIGELLEATEKEGIEDGYAEKI